MNVTPRRDPGEHELARRDRGRSGRRRRPSAGRDAEQFDRQEAVTPGGLEVLGHSGVFLVARGHDPLSTPVRPRRRRARRIRSVAAPIALEDADDDRPRAEEPDREHRVGRDEQEARASTAVIAPVMSQSRAAASRVRVADAVVQLEEAGERRPHGHQVEEQAEPAPESARASTPASTPIAPCTAKRVRGEPRPANDPGSGAASPARRRGRRRRRRSARRRRVRVPRERDHGGRGEGHDGAGGGDDPVPGSVRLVLGGTAVATRRPLSYGIRPPV